MPCLKDTRAHTWAQAPRVCAISKQDDTTEAAHSPSPQGLMKVLVTQSCPTLCDPMDCSPRSMEFSRPEYWTGSPFPSPGVSS